MSINILHKIKIKTLIAFSLLACISFSSCNDFLDIDSKHAAPENKQWKSYADVRSALMGVYGLTRAAVSENNTHWICGELRMGDFTVYNRNDLKSVVNNELIKPYSLLDEVSNWRRFYAAINAAAVFIEKAPQVVLNDRSYSEVNLTNDIAQVKALRAFLYFYMVRIWGDVPLVTESYDNGSFPEIARTDQRVVLNYARGELLEVIDDLPFKHGGSKSNLYYGQEYAYWRGVLFNKLSAYAILAHISAWEGNYANAETYAAYVMDNAAESEATYTAIADLTSETGIYASKSASKIISFNYSYDYFESTKSGHLEELTLAYPFVQKTNPDIYITKDSLYSIFSDLNDLRFGIDTVTLKYSTNYIHDLNATIPIFSKVKVIQNGKNEDGDYAVFGSSIIFTRLEELTLLRAEALIVLNRPTEAIVYLNNLRKNRNLRDLSYKSDFKSDDKKLLKTIFEERRKELMGEGWRWYDMIRQQRLLGDNEKMGKLIDEGGIYWPIAQDVLSANSSINQNGFWE